MQSRAYSFDELLVKFSPMFSAPSFENFTLLVTGWLVCQGGRTISRVIQFGGLGSVAHYTVFYRFFSRAKWDADRLGLYVLELALGLLPHAWPVVLLVDDTLCRKSGPHIWGASMHHDPLLSNYGRGKTAIKFFSFGHNWVIVSMCLPLPWNLLRVIAVPVGFRLYRSKKRCPAKDYRKRTELARDLMNKILPRIPSDRKVQLVADAEYACKTLVYDLPRRVTFVGPMHMDAALYAEPKPHQKGRGRPPKKGNRLMSPKQLIRAATTPWQSQTMVLYGREVEVLVKSQQCLWYRVAGIQKLRMIVTRDPKGRIDDRAYFCTDAETSVEGIARSFSFRWAEEEMHRNVKQFLGLEDPQNGWWRRPAGQRRDTTVPGPQPHEQRGRRATEHTVPFILTTYALVVLWYLAHGSPKKDVERVHRRAPWYTQKKEPSFGDMLAALRRHLWTIRNIGEPAKQQHSTKNFDSLSTAMQDLLTAA